jgi:hypothetical protein
MDRAQLDNRTRRSSVHDAAFIARHSVDPAFLADLLARDKRKAVRAALTANPCFPASTLADLVTGASADRASIRADLFAVPPRVLLDAVRHDPAVAEIAARHLSTTAWEGLAVHAFTAPASSWVPLLTSSLGGLSMLHVILEHARPGHGITDTALWDIVDAAGLEHDPARTDDPDWGSARSRVRAAVSKHLATVTTDQPAALARAPWPELALALAAQARTPDVPLTLAALTGLNAPELTSPILQTTVACMLLNAGTVLDDVTVTAVLRGSMDKIAASRIDTIEDSGVAALLDQLLAAQSPEGADQYSVWSNLAGRVIKLGSPAQVADLVCGCPGDTVFIGAWLDGAAGRLDEPSVARIAKGANPRAAVPMAAAWVSKHGGGPHADLLVRVLAERAAAGDPKDWAGSCTAERSKVLAAAAVSESTVLALTDAIGSFGVTALTAAYWLGGSVNEDSRRRVLQVAESSRFGPSASAFWVTITGIPVGSVFGIPPILRSLPAVCAPWLREHAPAAATYLVTTLTDADDLPILGALALDEPTAAMLRRPGLASELGRWLAGELGDRTDVWETALGLLPDWDGSIVGLAAAARSLSGPEREVAVTPPAPARTVIVSPSPASPPAAGVRVDLGR